MYSVSGLVIHERTYVLRTLCHVQATVQALYIHS